MKLEDQIRELKIEFWPIEKILPYDQNAKTHTDSQLEKLDAIIESQGWDVPCVVDENGELIKGHGRRLVGMRKQLKELPVIVRSDMTEAQKKAARIADNEIVNFGVEYDEDMLRSEMEDIAALDSDIDLSIFDDKFFVGDSDPVDLGEPELAAPEPEEKPGKDVAAVEPPETSYLVVVHCSGEPDQESVYNRMVADGYKCKVQTL